MAAFWLAILLQLLFSMWLGLTPVQGRIDGWGPDPITGFYTIDAVLRGDWETLGQALRYLVLPTLTLALPAMATIVRFTRAGVLNVMSVELRVLSGGDGHPAPARRVEIHPARRADRHADADRPDLRQPARQTPSWSRRCSTGPASAVSRYNSILQSDYNAIMGFTLFAGSVFILVNLLVDIAQALLDPRGR